MAIWLDKDLHKNIDYTFIIPRTALLPSMQPEALAAGAFILAKQNTLQNDGKTTK